jgi:lipid-binding SYLF domain-containing protein
MLSRAVIVLAMIACAVTPARSADVTEAQQLVEKSRMTWDDFAASPVLSSEVRDWLRVAKGVFIVPQILRGAALFGVAGGSGVLLVRDEKTGEWSEPAFYTVRSISFGLQVGADVSELIIVVRSDRGLEHFYSSQFKLGIDTSVAAGPMGGGIALKGLTADLFSYARAKGAFGGMAAEGAQIAVAETFNQAYYGQPVRPTEILVKRSVTNPHSLDLRKAVAGGMR